MTKEDKFSLAEWSIEQAKKHSATEVAVAVHERSSNELEIRDGNIDKLQQSLTVKLVLQVYLDGKYAVHSTNNLDKNALSNSIKETVKTAKWMSKDKFRHLPEPKYYAKDLNKELNIRDSSYERIENTEKISLAHKIEKASLAANDKVLSAVAFFEDSLRQTIRVHSNGFAGYDSSTGFTAGAFVTIDDGDKRPADYDFASVRNFRDLPDAETLGRKATERAMQRAGQQKLDSGKYDIVVENRAGGRLLYMLLRAMQARRLDQKETFLEGKLGQSIASDKFTMIDEPLMVQALGSRLFDAEGLACRKRVMIEKGVLKNFYIDNYYGRKLQMEPTSGSASNLVFEYGTKSLAMLLKPIKKGILVTNFLGGNSSGATGDFSTGIAGRLISDGELGTAVGGMNISGNQKDFWMRLAEVANDIFQYSSRRTASMLFEDIDVSGV